MALEDFARQLGRGKFPSWSHGHHAFRVVGELVHAKPSARRRVPDAYALIEGKWLRPRLPAVHYQCTSDDNRGCDARRQERSLVHFSLRCWLSDSDAPQRSSSQGSNGGSSAQQLPAVHIIAGQTSESRQAHHGSARLGGEAKAESQDDLQNAKSRQAIELDNDCALPFFAPAGVRDVNRCPNASHARSSECTLCRVMRGADLPVTIRRPPQSSRTPAGGRIRFQSRDKRVGVV